MYHALIDDSMTCLLTIISRDGRLPKDENLRNTLGPAFVSSSPRSIQLISRRIRDTPLPYLISIKQTDDETAQ